MSFSDLPSQQKEELLNTSIHAALNAGKAILEVYESEFAVEHKDDKSPLTLADKRGHEEIMQVLESTGMPVLSEEGRSIPYDERSQWPMFWMVDPLDGTKEFVKRNGEFTVNIALIEGGTPVLGVIYVPVKQVLYFGHKEFGAYKQQNVETYGKLSAYQRAEIAERLPAESKDRDYTIVASRSHMSADTEAFIEERRAEHGNLELTSIGSSLKICLVAEGSADVYPRYAPTMEWDTAAGHAIALCVNKDILDKKTGRSMVYNKRDLLNNWFVVE